MNINEMRELKNVVEHIMANPDLAEQIYEIANEMFRYKINNAGIDAIDGEYESKAIKEARASLYLYDLIHSITMYMEDGNDSSITMNSKRYPNATQPDWNTANESESEDWT